MSFRDSILDNFAGDLEYHPRRGAFYLFLAAAAFSRFYFASDSARFTVTYFVLAFGAVTLFIKGVFLCRKSSEGLGLTETDLSRLSARKDLPSVPNLASQIVQDFGAGPLFLWPLLRVGKDDNVPWSVVNEFHVLLAGLVLFGLGWILRYATKEVTIGD